jgi:hypothetical protein
MSTSLLLYLKYFFVVYLLTLLLISERRKIVYNYEMAVNLLKNMWVVPLICFGK